VEVYSFEVKAVFSSFSGKGELLRSTIKKKDNSGRGRGKKGFHVRSERGRKGHHQARRRTKGRGVKVRFDEDTLENSTTRRTTRSWLV